MRLLVLAVDGLQPAYLGPYGNEWIETPTLDRWAASGVVFDGHLADGPTPELFRRAILTGRHPLAAPGQPADLLETLKGAGVRTARIGPPLTPDDPFRSGWELEMDTERDPDEPLALKPTRRAVRKGIEQLGDTPNALLWIEIDALLPPWQPSEDSIAELFAEATLEGEDDDEPEEMLEPEPAQAEPLEPWTDALPDQIAADDDRTFARLQLTYAAAVASLDAGLGRLLDDCTKRGWGEEALWVLTSGRGFPLGEHESVGFAAAQLHTELAHLSLMVRWPNAEHAGWRVNALTQPHDLAPTLRELFGAETGHRTDSLTGGSLVSLAQGQDQELRPQALTGRQHDDRMAWGVRSRDCYLLVDDSALCSRRLYLKPDDRWEVNDVYQHHTELAEQIERQLNTLLAK